MKHEALTPDETVDACHEMRTERDDAVARAENAERALRALLEVFGKIAPPCEHPDCLGTDNPKPAMWWAGRHENFRRCDEHRTADKYGAKYANVETPWAATYRAAAKLWEGHE